MIARLIAILAAIAAVDCTLTYGATDCCCPDAADVTPAPVVEVSAPADALPAVDGSATPDGFAEGLDGSGDGSASP